jgi:hypothetical protein
MTLSESQAKVHPAWSGVAKLMRVLGIDLNKWQYSKGEMYVLTKRVTFYWSHPTVEDISMMVDYGERGNTWVIEQFGMDID